MPAPFRQRRFFYYLSGADFEDCIVTYDIKRDDLRLYIPPINPEKVIWLGPTQSIEECQEKYDVDYVFLTNDVDNYIINWLQNSQDKKPIIYILHKDQAPLVGSLGTFLQMADWEKKPLLNWTLLQPAMEAARVIKSNYEVGLIRRANQITSLAHRAVLANLSGMSNETQIEARFVASCVSAGAKKQAYEVIAGSGENASTLHYVANNQPLKGRQLVCLDAGCEWECYASDVTRTFPISGTFSKEAEEIYSIVQEMQEGCIERVKPGVIFRDLHLLAMEIAVKGLMKLGILHNGTFEEILPTGIAFFPHGVCTQSLLNNYFFRLTSRGSWAITSDSSATTSWIPKDYLQKLSAYMTFSGKNVIFLPPWPPSHMIGVRCSPQTWSSPLSLECKLNPPSAPQSHAPLPE